MSNLSLGEKRVRTEFNPSKSTNIDLVKQRAAEFINLMETHKSINPSPEKIRLLSLAQTAEEEAAMWAVKALTI